ncbi:MAG: pilus assembly protein TadG-related protein [Anaerolineales bacterium]
MIRKKSEKGQAIILIVFAIVGLIGITGLTVDGGLAYSDRRNAQSAADGAALSAALELAKGQTGWASAARSTASTNGYNNNGTHNTVTVHNPPDAGCNGVSGPYAGNSEYVQVIINTNVQTYFAPVVGISQAHNCVEAIARSKPGTTAPPFDGYAVVALSQHDQQAFFVHGNAKAEVEGGVFVNSDHPTKAFFKNGSSKLEIEDKPMDIVGGYTNAGGGQIKGTINTGGSQISPDNLPFQLPNPTCGNQQAAKSDNTMTPGNWSGTFPPAKVTTLQPGVYCVDGNFRLNGGDTLSGTDVVIYMISGGVTWNGNSVVNLHAPTSGIFGGLLLYLPPTNGSAVTINGNNGSCVEGSIIAPSSPIAVLGNAGAPSAACGDHPEEEEFEIEGQVIGYTVEMGGNIKTEIEYESSNKYQATIPAAIELAK